MYYNMKCDCSSIGRGWKVWGIISVLLAIIFGVMGWNKYIINPYSTSNMYVGGDAYNYIINASRATALFVVSGICVLSAIGSGVMCYLAKIAHTTNLQEDKDS